MRQPAPRLPIPESEHWELQLEARCRTEPVETFSTPQGTRGAALRRIEMVPKEHCALCPVRDPCRRYAMEFREPYGIRGGLSAAERFFVLSNSSDVARPQDDASRPCRTVDLRLSPGATPPGRRARR
ncbi:WhiB family transcriptional regulator [Rhodococcoides fascians A25f]|uniref:WhiB family transcriptional regulator n=1 Tax=Rhodococcoides fascians TaxID=1828 RepID=UPI0009B8EDE4|nr:WhiB family transcriptional regulator [Rhodococcus fascians]QII07387.1 WhiB family transcriptional regulator [Rhodococcus fascians A25f]